MVRLTRLIFLRVLGGVRKKNGPESCSPAERSDPKSEGILDRQPAGMARPEIAYCRARPVRSAPFSFNLA
jgi:hypothetical protein